MRSHSVLLTGHPEARFPADDAAGGCHSDQTLVETLVSPPGLAVLHWTDVQRPIG